jgi:hypothetical protein
VLFDWRMFVNISKVQFLALQTLNQSVYNERTYGAVNVESKLQFRFDKALFKLRAFPLTSFKHKLADFRLPRRKINGMRGFRDVLIPPLFPDYAPLNPLRWYIKQNRPPIYAKSQIPNPRSQAH